MYYNQIHLKHLFLKKVVTITRIIQNTSWSFSVLFHWKIRSQYNQSEPCLYLQEGNTEKVIVD